MKKELISIEQALADHGLEVFSPDKFLVEQRKGLNGYIFHSAHNARIEIIDSGKHQPLLIKKSFGVGERKIPFDIAGSLADDYMIHEGRLRNFGVRIAENYGITVQRDGESGVITVHQLFFPQGTLVDWLREKHDPTLAIYSSIRDTLMPVLTSKHPEIPDDECWVFLDNAPKNIAPVQKPNQEIDVFYFDFFVPRIRNLDGSLKIYNGYNFHVRPEAEMKDRFFTIPGIINNFLQKTRADLIDLPDIWHAFSSISQREIQPYLEKYFPNQEIDDIAIAKYSRSNTVVK